MAAAELSRFPASDSGAPGFTWRLAGAVAVAGVGAGLAAASGLPGLLVAGAILAALGLVLVGRRIPTLFMGALGVLLTGYAFLDKGLAHVGFGVFYVGEVVLGLGVLALLLSLPRVRISFVEVTIGAFMAWGAFRTVPYIGLYGVDAFRDAVQWGYALFALLVMWLLDRARVETAVHWYARIALPLALWLPIAVILTEVISGVVPPFPGSDVSLVYLKSGDAGVMLAGIAAFVLAGLAPNLILTSEMFLWAGWSLTALIVSALNRGAMIAAATTILIALFARRLMRWVALGAAGTLLLSIALIANPTVDIGGQRNISVQQVVTNALGIVGTSDVRNQETKAWRADWWTTIVNYTVHGPYFWTGKGFGINLADDDGFQVNSDKSLRAPHSAHFEFLARAGVPGLALWILVLAAFVLSVLQGARRAYRAGDRFLLAVLGWLTVYWVAAVLNMSVDVYLGGPQGGIPFWCAYGAGIAVARMAGRKEAVAAEHARRGPDPVRAAHRPTPTPLPGLPV